MKDVSEEQEKLVAAAPELLEALQLLFEDWKTLVGEDLKENNSDVLNLWNKTIAAIAKATGDECFSQYYQPQKESDLD